MASGAIIGVCIAVALLISAVLGLGCKFARKENKPTEGSQKALLLSEEEVIRRYENSDHRKNAKRQNKRERRKSVTFLDERSSSNIKHTDKRHLPYGKTQKQSEVYEWIERNKVEKKQGQQPTMPSMDVKYGDGVGVEWDREDAYRTTHSLGHVGQLNRFQSNIASRAQPKFKTVKDTVEGVKRASKCDFDNGRKISLLTLNEGDSDAEIDLADTNVSSGNMEDVNKYESVPGRSCDDSRRLLSRATTDRPSVHRKQREHTDARLTNTAYQSSGRRTPVRPHKIENIIDDTEYKQSTFNPHHNEDTHSNVRPPNPSVRTDNDHLAFYSQNDRKIKREPYIQRRSAKQKYGSEVDNGSCTSQNTFMTEIPSVEESDVIRGGQSGVNHNLSKQPLDGPMPHRQPKLSTVQKPLTPPLPPTPTTTIQSSAGRHMHQSGMTSSRTIRKPSSPITTTFSPGQSHQRQYTTSVHTQSPMDHTDISVSKEYDWPTPPPPPPPPLPSPQAAIQQLQTVKSQPAHVPHPPSHPRRQKQRSPLPPAKTTPRPPPVLVPLTSTHTPVAQSSPLYKPSKPLKSILTSPVSHGSPEKVIDNSSETEDTAHVTSLACGNNPAVVAKILDNTNVYNTINTTGESIGKKSVKIRTVSFEGSSDNLDGVYAESKTIVQTQDVADPLSEDSFMPGDTSTPQQSNTDLADNLAGDIQTDNAATQSDKSMINSVLQRRRRFIAKSDTFIQSTSVDNLDDTTWDESISPRQKSFSTEETSFDKGRKENVLELKSACSIVQSSVFESPRGLSQKLESARKIRDDPDVVALLADIKTKRKASSSINE